MFRSLVLSVLLLTALAAYAATHDIRSYGAQCDGVTDDGPALQAAIDAATPGDTVVVSGMCGLGTSVVMSGKHAVTVTGKNPDDGFKILAVGNAQIVAFIAIMIKVTDCSDCVVEKLTFNGNDICASMVGVDKSRNVTLRELDISDVASNGKASAAITAAGNHNNTYTHITINTPHVKSGGEELRGMWIGNWWAEAAEWNPTITYNTIRYVPATGIATHTVAPIISHNIVEYTGGAGIKTVPCENVDTKAAYPGQTVIEKNVLNFNKFHGYQDESGSGVLVKDNWMEGNLMNGILVTGNVRGLVITGNVFINNRSSGQSGGLWIHGLSDSVISDNTFVETRQGEERQQWHGLGFIPQHAGFENVSVTGNLFEGHLGSGIRLERRRFPYNNVDFTSNVFQGNGGPGIEALEADSAVTSKGNLYLGNAGTITGLAETEGELPLAAPAQRTMQAAVTISTTNLTWAPVPGATAYLVEVSQNRFVDQFDRRYAGITQTSLEVSDLFPRKAYYWRVRAVDGARQSPWSSPGIFTTLGGSTPPG